MHGTAYVLVHRLSFNINMLQCSVSVRYMSRISEYADANEVLGKE